MESLLKGASANPLISQLEPKTEAPVGSNPWAKSNGFVRGNDTIGSRVKVPNEPGRIPSRKLDSAGVSRQVVLAHPMSRDEEKKLHFTAQRFRLLSNRLVEVANNLNSQVFLITSALAGEGKTLTSANLAFALSGIERKRTLLIDLDLRRYSLHSLLGLQASTKERPFLEAEDWRDCVWSLRTNLDVLLSQTSADHPNELLQSVAVRKLFAEARREYDFILIDSAPLLLAADTHALLPLIDQAFLVVRADFTPIACSQDALKVLGDKAAGCILNDVKRLKYQNYYQGYYGSDDNQ